MRPSADPLEEWALRCRSMGVTISLDSSGAPPPYGERWWKDLEVQDSNDEAEGEELLRDVLSSHYGVERERIALTAGAQHANFLFLLAFGPGDLVAVESPTFMPLRQQVDMVCRAFAIRRDPDRDFLLHEDDLEEASRRGAKALVLTNLHNPSAAEMGDEDLGAVIERAERRGMQVLVDEVYREMSYGMPPAPAFSLGEEACSVSSVTKLNGLRGLRIGWLIGSERTAKNIEQTRMLASYRLPPRNLTLAAEAVRRQSWFRERMLRRASRNLPILYEWLQYEERVSCPMPDGSLMALIQLPPGVDDLAFSEMLLERGVAVGPGRYWGAPGHIRVTFSCPPRQLVEGLEAISCTLDRHFSVR